MSLSRPFGCSMRARWLLALVLVLSGLGSAQAADTCLVAATPIAFGAYDTTATVETSGRGDITVDCQGNKEVAVTIVLSAGNGSYAARYMRSPLDALQYNLYLDAAHSRVFGDGTGGSEAATCITGITGGGCSGSNPSGAYKRAVLPFYGRIPPMQDVAAGNYGDAVQVTIIF